MSSDFNSRSREAKVSSLYKFFFEVSQSDPGGMLFFLPVCSSHAFFSFSAPFVLSKGFNFFDESFHSPWLKGYQGNSLSISSPHIPDFFPTMIFTPPSEGFFRRFAVSLFPANHSPPKRSLYPSLPFFSLFPGYRRRPFFDTILRVLLPCPFVEV